MILREAPEKASASTATAAPVAKKPKKPKRIKSPAQELLTEWIRTGEAKLCNSMSMKAITADDTILQFRERTDPEWVQVFYEEIDRWQRMQGQPDCPDPPFPVVVFHDEGAGVYWLADGYHRFRAHEKLRLKSIRAYVIKGTLEDAVRFAATCNLARSGHEPSREDIKHGFMKLLENERFFAMTDMGLGCVAAVGATTAKRWRAEYCDRHGCGVPDRLISADGRLYPANGQGGVASVNASTKRGKPILIARAQAAGRDFKVYIGIEDGVSQEQIDAAKAEVERRARDWRERQAELVVPKSSYAACGVMARSFISRGVASSVESMGAGDCLASLRIGLARVVTQAESTPTDYFASFGKIMLARKRGTVAREIILAPMPRHGASGKAISLIREAGVEVMTADELIAELAPKADADTDDSPVELESVEEGRADAE